MNPIQESEPSVPVQEDADDEPIRPLSTRIIEELLAFVVKLVIYLGVNLVLGLLNGESSASVDLPCESNTENWG